ncbi:TOMM precursor leader peptide-binding protein [Natronosporangium hydrolyticum]|uniref:TOMM leader peptide-binding protein n=1 Tax=Natronosporangium hydrolyticum TaxID=2811111 RepID=A0A895YB58_9ACTN|nr:TOMM precursor leader peptide-binding protein [Natronosporangium hydrolyticum]QSB12703.1 TOMM precursor leader peptide-binding protein [Natronosporangium hydrolyticum]
MATPHESDPATFALASTARVMEDGSGRFRIRTGVWNFEEAVIDVSAEPPAVAATVQSALRALADGVTILTDHLDPQLLPIERANVERLFADLAQAGVVVAAQDRLDQQAITAALLGRLVSPYPGGGDPPEREVRFWSDSPGAVAQAERLAEDLRLRLVPLPEATVTQLERADLTSNIEAYQTSNTVAELRGQLAGAAAVVTCFLRPSVPVLRNLNRVLEGQDVPWVSALVDGPFLSAVGVKSPHSGCFECFEQRSLARLEDHVAYHEFTRTAIGAPPPRGSDAPVMHLLASLAVTEGYLHAATGSSRLSGRAVSVHLPTFEIQTQDLLRMPNCPACGRVSKQRLREINFNSRAAVDRIVSAALQ